MRTNIPRRTINNWLEPYFEEDYSNSERLRLGLLIRGACATLEMSRTDFREYLNIGRELARNYFNGLSVPSLDKRKKLLDLINSNKRKPFSSWYDLMSNVRDSNRDRDYPSLLMFYSLKVLARGLKSP